MRYTITFLSLVLTLLFATPIWAMEITVRGDQIIASGSVEAVDEPRLSLALADPEVRELVLLNASGGSMSAALAMGRMVAKKRLRTVVIGFCEDACALIFLGGAERRFAKGQHPRKTYILLSGLPVNESTNLSLQIQEFLQKQLGLQYNNELFKKSLASTSAAHSTLRAPEIERNASPDNQAQLCTLPLSTVNACRFIVGKNAFDLGLLTAPSNLAIGIPIDLLPQITLFDIPLTEPAANLPKLMLEQAQQMCADDTVCYSRFQAAIPRYEVQKSFRATVLGVDKRGFGFSDNQTSPDAAVKRAIYLCNHAVGNPKLCRAVVVDDFDVSAQYKKNVMQSQLALENLVAPKHSSWAGENTADSKSALFELRYEKQQQATALDIDGIVRWGTMQLAQAMKSKSVNVVDVEGIVKNMLPGAVHMWEGGVAFEESEVDRAYDMRFRQLIEIIQPDKKKALVFYCADVSCWAAANAAIRAAKAGYLNAGWYRGGLRSWLEAGLPVVQKVPSSVVN